MHPVTSIMRTTEVLKDHLKLINNNTEYFRPQRMVAELNLSDLFLELAVGGVLELVISRSELYIFESLCPQVQVQMHCASMVSKT